MVELKDLGEAEIDALNELGNIGVGNAATALSQMLGRTINISVPEVRVVEISKLHTIMNTEKVVAGVITALNDLESGVAGYLYVMFPEESSRRIVTILLGSDEDQEMRDSTLMELGNILSSSFCDATAEMLGIMLIPTPPSFAEDYSIAVIDAVVSQFAEKSDHIIVFETELKEEDDAVEILVVLIPNETFLNYIIKMLNMVD